MERNCTKCGEFTEHHAKGFCYRCYKQQWTAPQIICKRCKAEKPHHSHGLCASCNVFVNHYDKVRTYNARKYHNISLEVYEEVTGSCLICGFDTIVELHHIDRNHSNNHRENLIGLCPNHHKMLHHTSHSEEIQEIINKKIS